MVIFFRDADVTGLPAIRTIIQPIDAKANIVLRLAEATILLADTLRLGLIALRANDGHLDVLLVPATSPIHSIVGQEGTRDKQLWQERFLTERVHAGVGRWLFFA
jgi:hypothetical protein